MQINLGKSIALFLWIIECDQTVLRYTFRYYHYTIKSESCRFKISKANGDNAKCQVFFLLCKENAKNEWAYDFRNDEATVFAANKILIIERQ